MHGMPVVCHDYNITTLASSTYNLQLTDFATQAKHQDMYLQHCARCCCIAGQEMSNTAGHVAVQELDWSNLEHYAPVNPPFDYVLAADCVYHEQIVEDFLRTVLAMTHSKSTG